MTAANTRILAVAVAAALAAVAVAVPGAARAAVEPPAGGADADAPRVVPGEVLVRFKPAVDGGERAEVRSEEDVDLEERLPVPGLEKVDTEGGTSVKEAVRDLEDRPEVAYAQPNFVRQVAAAPDPGETLFDELWGLRKIGAPAAWDTTTGSDGVVVAVVDSGVDYEHPDLAGNIWENEAEADGEPGVDDDGNARVDDVRGWDFCGRGDRYPQSQAYECGGGDRDPIDEDGHGTHVAGTIGADGTNGGGLPGVNWETALMPVRVADGQGFTSDSLLVQGFTYAVDNGAKVVNASFGGKGPAAAPALQQVIRGSQSTTLFAVAAGNGTNGDGNRVNNDKSPDFLCNIEAPNLVCVTASTQSDELASFANFGVGSVDLAAPGVDVLSTSHGTDARLDENFETDPFAGSQPWITGDTVEDPAGTTEEEDARWGWTGEGQVPTEPHDWAVADSPGEEYAPDTTSDVESPRFTPPDPGLCTVSYDLQLALDEEVLDPPDDALGLEDSLTVEAVPAGAPGAEPVELARYSESTAGVQSRQLPAFDDASGVRLRFTLDTDAVGQADGAEVDDVKVECGGYEEMSGTSMATPHVAGAAALGFAHENDATPAQMKCALVAGVDSIPNPFAYTTASGGRLDAAGTLALLDPSNPPAACITAAPPRRGSDDTVSFRFQASQPGSTFECMLDGVLVDCGSLLARRVADGDHTVQVRARSSESRSTAWNGSGQLVPTHRFLVDTTGPRMGLPGRRLELSGRRIPVRLRCPAAEASGPCAGNVRLRSKDRIKVGKRKRRITLGKAQFRVAPGDASSVTIRVSRRDRRLVERRGKLRVTARAVAIDSLWNGAARSKHFRLSD